MSIPDSYSCLLAYLSSVHLPANGRLFTYTGISSLHLKIFQISHLIMIEPLITYPFSCSAVIHFLCINITLCVAVVRITGHSKAEVLLHYSSYLCGKISRIEWISSHFDCFSWYCTVKAWAKLWTGRKCGLIPAQMIQIKKI